MTSERPSQADFAILTINGTEDQGVRDVFGYGTSDGILSESRHYLGHRGAYSWGRVEASDGHDEFVIVHASSGDRKGPLAAAELVREVDQLFRPGYLLVVGTAGGIQKRNMTYGQVMFSRQVHVGYQNLVDRRDRKSQDGQPCRPVRVTLHDDPVQPPLDRLHSYAQKVADRWTRMTVAAAGEGKGKTTSLKSAYAGEMPVALIAEATEKIMRLGQDLPLTEKQASRLQPSPIPEVRRKDNVSLVGSPSIGKQNSDLESGLPKWKEDLFVALNKIDPPASGEIFSGSYLVDGKKSELYQSILRTFLKVRAIEMEAGAVAQAVLYSVETDRYIGYLVIKGMSDVIDSNVPREYRKEVRKALGPLASWASAQFTLDLIRTWQRTSGRSFSEVSLVPAKYSSAITRELNKKKFSNAEVYVEVSVEQYSRLLKAICDGSPVRSIWTICYLAPWRFIDALKKDGTAKANPNPSKICADCANGDAAELIKELKQEFPHFKVFLDLASEGVPVTRILHSGKGWKENNLKCLSIFRGLCLQEQATIKCSILNDGDFEGEDRWAKSDQTVINDELLMDYDMDKRRLIVTFLRDGLKENFVRFRKHCEEMSKRSDRGYDAYLQKHLINKVGDAHKVEKFFNEKPARSTAETKSS